MNDLDIIDSAIGKTLFLGSLMFSRVLRFVQNLKDQKSDELLKLRRQQIGPNVSVFYEKKGGLVITKGKGVFMMDNNGNRYLDCCNNVACVGHSHPTVVEAGCNELARIQTNSRFLHPVQQRYISKLLATFPPELNTIYLVNSGSEANDLAIRIAFQANKATNKSDIICIDHAYHGHTAALIGISPYKWYQATDGVNRQPTSTHLVSCPDTFRGKYRLRKNLSKLQTKSAKSDKVGTDNENNTLLNNEQEGISDYETNSTWKDVVENGNSNEDLGIEKISQLYAQEVVDVVTRFNGIGTFIAESIISCGGQIIPPPGYLQSCYQVVRKYGGICIADEVQTGFGRFGSHFWGFQAHGVIPDIVTIGEIGCCQYTNFDLITNYTGCYK